MSNFISYIVDEADNGDKIRNYLKYKCNLSSRFCRSAALNKNILVNGEVVKLSYILKAGDKIEINLKKEESQDIAAEKMDLDIIYEDNDIIIINKPPNLVVHPTKSHQSGTLANGVLYHFRENGDSSIVRLVSRLDMNTSGLIIIAKNQFSHMALQREMTDGNVDKIYRAICHNTMNEKEGTIDLPIYASEESKPRRIVDERGQRSITHFKVIEELKDATYIELKLETGRTHQIRVHLAYNGCPIFSDNLYGKEEKEYIGRQSLHAYKLRFNHPKTGEKMEFVAPIPEDMLSLLEKLK
ncbi:RluA family pseudouridine synthase [Clostridium bornimense]|uniref:RluA family pseudouridine synthase n=1 Tax=Clostridium bornimense TaxID=1216932 RepID=UPI001C123649|nr:RluA family pseudouridine synthase [Clostridium bornimense]MBU5315790.1 RluA family pseudouridine synthase [Clostridium bornimense]